MWETPKHFIQTNAIFLKLAKFIYIFNVFLFAFGNPGQFSEL